MNNRGFIHNRRYTSNSKTRVFSGNKGWYNNDIWIKYIHGLNAYLSLCAPVFLRAFIYLFTEKTLLVKYFGTTQFYIILCLMCSSNPLSTLFRMSKNKFPFLFIKLKKKYQQWHRKFLPISNIVIPGNPCNILREFFMLKSFDLL